MSRNIKFQSQNPVDNHSINEIYLKAKKFINQKNYQVAEILLSKALELDHQNRFYLMDYAYVTLMLEDYHISLQICSELVKNEPYNAYINKFMGLCLVRLGNTEKGIWYLKKSIEYANNSSTDTYYDLALIYLENNRFIEAKETLAECKSKYPNFTEKRRYLYKHLENIS